MEERAIREVAGCNLDLHQISPSSIYISSAAGRRYCYTSHARWEVQLHLPPPPLLSSFLLPSYNPTNHRRHHPPLPPIISMSILLLEPNLSAIFLEFENELFTIRSATKTIRRSWMPPQQSNQPHWNSYSVKSRTNSLTLPFPAAIRIPIYAHTYIYNEFVQMNERISKCN